MSKKIETAAANLTHADRVTQAVQRGLLGDQGDPQLAEFAAHFVHLAGGPRGLAKMVFDTYQNTESTMMRHRIIDSVLRSVKFANEQAGPKSDLGLASDEDLMRELQQVIGKVEENEASSGPQT